MSVWTKGASDTQTTWWTDAAFQELPSFVHQARKALISQCQRSHHTESWCKSTERVCDVCWFNAPCKEEDIKGRVPETSFQGLHHLWKTSPGQTTTQQWTPQSHVSSRPTCSQGHSVFLVRLKRLPKAVGVSLTTEDQHSYEKETSKYQVDNKLPAMGRWCNLTTAGWRWKKWAATQECVLQSYP